MRALGLLGCTLVLTMSLAGCGKTATQKATDDFSKSVEKVAQSQNLIDLDQRKVTADKAIVVLATDVLLGQSDSVLVADTSDVLADLRGMPEGFRESKLPQLLTSTASAGCVQCTHLIEAAMG